ncbi:uncharacterized protein LOC125075637 [Vanessa atalanta]|uniref:uncharacterized protein LOC125075637 n=1 Tax=Vanessa atalanta TaxID=42275 RepID=UPI001FCDDA4D|nr:uncharacterized protein LOC125075637 [Vanessa atalanta]
MQKSETINDMNAVYLAHHAVIREEKDTTKVRVVFDASAKGSGDFFLNDTMMVGPVLQQDLRSLITTWRTHKVCVISDIEKMYRMIKLTDEHTKLQRILWRDSPDKNLESYDLTTVTFGTAAAPYLAVRTLNQVADDEAEEYPDTVVEIKGSFYVDDYMSGSDNIEKTKKLCNDIKTVLKKGGFKMQKWSSLTWDRKDDTFKVTVNLPELTYPITKRSILSDVARLFDPFGWLSPLVIVAKILIQKLWLCNLGWDDELPVELVEEWKSYRDDLPELKTIEILRWFHTSSGTKEIQIHGFADASVTSYAAVTYLRVFDEKNNVHITLIASRTRVAPLKQLTIPKLELCAAALLSELIEEISGLLKIPIEQIFAYTDSMVVLSWLQSQPHRWRTFVGNRVADVLRVLDNSRWSHIKSEENPADIATRGVKASDLRDTKLWWNGPEWLNHRYIERSKGEIPGTDLERKSFNIHLPEEKTPIWEKFSSISKMKRVLSYCRRFLKAKNKGNIEKHLTINEMELILENLIIIIKYYQRKVYEKKIEDINKDGKVKKGSSLVTLSPFLDKNEMIRVGGRLQNANIAESSRHPIIIPPKVHVAKLLVKEAHIKTLHGGIQLMMAYIRSKYWIINLKNEIKKCIRTCKVCIVDKAKISTQEMGQLPYVRVNEHRAFLNTGVDYAGPIYIRTSKGRGHHATKAYICLFVCMATRAIHLEAVSDLTAQAFIASFRRFVARRGPCLHLWSDNGTNFIGAAKELKTLFIKGKANITEEIAELLANDGTTWHFIPPRMPNYGGLWEAGIQSVKRHLVRVNKSTKLTYEEMATLLAQIEACLNSRPLCQLDDTVETLYPLTPGHFLIGEPLITVPDINYELRNINLLSRRQMIQRMTQDFWRRWRIALQAREKSECVQTLITSQSMDRSCRPVKITLVEETMEQLDNQYYTLIFPRPTKVERVHYTLTNDIANIQNKLKGQPLKITEIPEHYTTTKNITIPHLKLKNINTPGLRSIEDRVLNEQPTN